MATIAENLLALNEAKTNIKVALENKGQDLTDVPFSEYGTVIENLPSDNSRERMISMINRTITELTLEDFEGVTRIGNGAFNYCQNLTTVEIKDSVTTIGNSSFGNCNKLVSINIPNSVTLLSGYMFNGCTSLPSIELPNSITKIDTYVFNNCKALASVILPTTPPTLMSVNAFNSVPSTCVFYCKTQESLEAYQAATNWSSLTSTYTFTVIEGE